MKSRGFKLSGLFLMSSLVVCVPVWADHDHGDEAVEAAIAHANNGHGNGNDHNHEDTAVEAVIARVMEKNAVLETPPEIPYLAVHTPSESAREAHERFLEQNKGNETAREAHRRFLERFWPSEEEETPGDETPEVPGDEIPEDPGDGTVDTDPTDDGGTTDSTTDPGTDDGTSTEDPTGIEPSIDSLTGIDPVIDMALGAAQPV